MRWHQHSQGPVDGLAADRLAVAQELADIADAVPVGAELAGGRLLLLGQPLLAPAVPAAGLGGGKAIPGALADEVALGYVDNPAGPSGSQIDEPGHERWVSERSDGPSTQRSARGVYLDEVNIEGSA
jgi:hypothetical protein